MYTKLSKIDELTVGDHYYLNDSDECYYLGEYTARKGYRYSSTNQHITNLKKSVDRRNRPEYRHKLSAMRQVAAVLDQLLNQATCNLATFIPVPPSKHHKDPLFDDRLLSILKQFSALSDKSIDFRDAVMQMESLDIPSHLSNVRKSPDELYDLYEVAQIEESSLRDVLVIFDDVITAGSHFKAMQRILSEAFPDKRIIGLFIARTERSSDMFDDISEIEF